MSDHGYLYFLHFTAGLQVRSMQSLKPRRSDDHSGPNSVPFIRAIYSVFDSSGVLPESYTFLCKVLSLRTDFRTSLI